MESLFKLMPDTSPCDMAIICRKPCFEVLPPLSRVLFPKHLIVIIIIVSNQIYIHREVIFSDEEILKTPSQQPEPLRMSAKIKFSKFLKSCIVIYISRFIVKTSRRRHLLICMVRAVHIENIMTALQSFFFSFRAVTCHHKGPCNQLTGCNCYNMKQRCQRMCSCSKDCKKLSP